VNQIAAARLHWRGTHLGALDRLRGGEAAEPQTGEGSAALPHIPPTGTEQDAIAARQRLRDRVIRVGVTEDDWTRAEANASARSEVKPEPGAVFWAVTEELVDKALSRSQWRRVSALYRDQARYLAETGQPWRSLRREAELAGLWDLNVNGFVKRVQLLTKGCCAACEVLNGTVVTVAAELGGPSIPAPGCDAPWCLCAYAPVI
jgi:hypothetical protein